MKSRKWKTTAWFISLPFSARRENTSGIEPEVAPDLSGAINFAPSADLAPNPRLLQRKNEELELRLAQVEEWIARQDKRFKPWLTR